MLTVAMYPDEQTPQPDFNFITGSPQANPTGVGGDNQKRRIIVVVLGVLGLFIVAMLFINIVSSGSRTGRSELIDLAAYQSELARVAAIGVEEGVSAEVRGRAAIVSFSIRTDAGQTRKLMAAIGAKASDEQLLAYRSNTIDTQFQEAANANNFDNVYSEVLDEKLNNYKGKIVEVFNIQTNEDVRANLRQFKTNADILSPDTEPAS